jgi:hypothetical protein
LRTKRALALVLIAIVLALLLAELFYATPNLFYRGSVIVRAYAIGSYGLLVWLTNASFSVWAWAPTPNGTMFMPVYNWDGALGCDRPGKASRLGRGLGARLWQGCHKRL